MENNNDDKWKNVNALIKKEKAGSQENLTQSLAKPVEAMAKKPEGIIAQYKANQIERKAALGFLKVWYGSQLEVAEHQLRTAVMLKKRATETDAERFLMDINAQQIQYLIDLGITNVEQRMEALEKLQDKTVKMYEKIRGKDWPQEMVDQTITAISSLNKRFFDKVMEEQEIDFKDKKS